MRREEVERRVGIAGYLTRSPGIGGRLKAAAEDFRVEEVPFALPAVEDGPYLLARVTSRNWETNRLVRALARTLGISRRRIRFAGTKDKRAITVQQMTFQGVAEESLAKVHLRDVSVEALHRTSRSLTLGDHMGNRFTLRIADLSLPPAEVKSRLTAIGAELATFHGFPNFFGLQRFGEVRPITHLVGRALVHGDLQEAVNLYLGHPFDEEEAEVRDARQAFTDSGDVREALRDFPAHLGFERALLNHLRIHPDDARGALLQLPENLLSLFVNAYQAYLFNQILQARLARDGLGEPWVGDLVLRVGPRGIPERNAPIPVTAANRGKVGKQVATGKAWLSGLIVGTEAPRATGEMGRLEQAVLRAEDVDLEAFRVSALPQLASRGQRRELLAPLMEFVNHAEEEGAAHASFRLNPGCYATVLLREIMKDSP